MNTYKEPEIAPELVGLKVANRIPKNLSNKPMSRIGSDRTWYKDSTFVTRTFVNGQMLFVSFDHVRKHVKAFWPDGRLDVLVPCQSMADARKYIEDRYPNPDPVSPSLRASSKSKNIAQVTVVFELEYDVGISPEELATRAEKVLSGKSGKGTRRVIDTGNMKWEF